MLTLQLAEAAPVDRVVLELPQGWGDRDQTIEVDGSTDGTTWTQLVAPTAYLFSANNAAGNNVVSIPVPSTTRELHPGGRQQQHRPGGSADRRVPGLLELAVTPASRLGQVPWPDRDAANRSPANRCLDGWLSAAYGGAH